MTLEEMQKEARDIACEIEALGSESIALPADVSLGYTTDRPELLKLVHRGLPQRDVEGVLDALAGEMKARRLWKSLANVVMGTNEELVRRLNAITKVAKEGTNAES